MATVKYLTFVTLFLTLCVWILQTPFELILCVAWFPIWGFVGLFVLIWILTEVFNCLIIRPARKNIDPDAKAVLITGCDSGFGFLTATSLHSYGFHVFAACIDANSEGACRLREAGDKSSNMTVIQMDVTNELEMQQAYKLMCETMDHKNIQLHSIINNAGINIPGMIEFAAPASAIDYQQVFDVNVFGVIRVCRLFVPLLRRGNPDVPPGRVINVSSQAAHTMAYGQSAYCMSKAALSCFTECLGMELARFNIKSILIEPFFYKTQEGNLPRFWKQIREAWSKTSAEVRKDYGIDVLQECMQSNRFFASSKLVASTNLQEVPDIIVEAVTSVDPDVRYFKVPLIAHVFLTILRCLPYDIRFELNKLQPSIQKVILSYDRTDDPKYPLPDVTEEEEQEKQEERIPVVIDTKTDPIPLLDSIPEQRESCESIPAVDRKEKSSDLNSESDMMPETFPTPEVEPAQCPSSSPSPELDPETIPFPEPTCNQQVPERLLKAKDVVHEDTKSSKHKSLEEEDEESE